MCMNWVKLNRGFHYTKTEEKFFDSNRDTKDVCDYYINNLVLCQKFKPFHVPIGQPSIGGESV